ncbi:MAG: hypothetical protein ACE5K3_05580 [bacterium]
MNKEKKEWETPKLICLYRGRPEEAVLQACKAPTLTGPAVYLCWNPPDKCRTSNTT